MLTSFLSCRPISMQPLLASLGIEHTHGSPSDGRRTPVCAYDQIHARQTPAVPGLSRLHSNEISKYLTTFRTSRIFVRVVSKHVTLRLHQGGYRDDVFSAPVLPEEGQGLAEAIDTVVRLHPQWKRESFRGLARDAYELGQTLFPAPYAVPLMLHQAELEWLIVPPLVDASLVRGKPMRKRVNKPEFLALWIDPSRLVGSYAYGRELLIPSDCAHVALDWTLLEFPRAMGKVLVRNAVFKDHLLERLPMSAGCGKVHYSVSATDSLTVMHEGLNPDDFYAPFLRATVNEYECPLVFTASIRKYKSQFSGKFIHEPMCHIGRSATARERNEE